MMIGLSGKDATIVLSLWNTYSEFLTDRNEMILPVRPLLRDITVPLSFFSTPLTAVGVDTVVSYPTFLVEPRNLNASFILQSNQLGFDHLFPFMTRERLGIPPFFPYRLRLVLRDPYQYVYKSATVDFAFVNRWEISVPENAPITVSLGWAFNSVNLEPLESPILYSVLVNDELLTIRNVSVVFGGEMPFEIPSDGIRGLNLRVDVNLRWLYRIFYLPQYRWANDAVVNSWQIQLDLTLTPDAMRWFGYHLERQYSLPDFTCSIYINSQSPTPNSVAFDLYRLKLLSGDTSVRVGDSQGWTLRLGAKEIVFRRL